jgi:hypothetical protein
MRFMELFSPTGPHLEQSGLSSGIPSQMSYRYQTAGDVIAISRKGRWPGLLPWVRLSLQHPSIHRVVGGYILWASILLEFQ